MKKLVKPSESKSSKSRVSAEELAKQLEKEETSPVTEPKKRGPKPKPKQEEVSTPPAQEEGRKSTSKVALLADKKKAKEAEKVNSTPPVADKKLAKNPPKSKKVVEEVDDDDDDGDSNDGVFEAVISGSKFDYVRLKDDEVTIENLTKHLRSGKFDIRMLLAEEREDGTFTNMVLCYISKETLTFIDQTGGEDFDSIVQVTHDQVIGKKELKLRKAKFPFALYVQTPKKAGK